MIILTFGGGELGSELLPRLFCLREMALLETTVGDQMGQFCGSCALCMVAGSSSADDARAQQIKVSTPIHRPFQEFKTCNLPSPCPDSMEETTRLETSPRMVALPNF